MSEVLGFRLLGHLIEMRVWGLVVAFSGKEFR